MDPGLVTLPPQFGLPRGRWDALDTSASVAARDATSVILVRDGEGGGVEVFLQHRVAEMSFAGGMTVFPGGSADARDRVRPPLAGPSPAAWTTVWGDDEDTAMTLLSSAVRETFEETGVLLAGPASDAPSAAGGPALAPEDVAALGPDRDALTAGTVGLAEVLTRAGLVLRGDLLAPWARWITPEPMPCRYDTRFFLALLPAGQHADGRTTEAVETGWTSPTAALDAWTGGTRALMPPTWAVLGQLAEHPDTGSLWAAAAPRRPVPVTPTFLPGEDQVGLAVPAGALAGGRR